MDPAFDLAKAAIPPIVTAAVAATVKWSVEANRRRSAPPAPSLVILLPGIRLDPRPQEPRTEFGPLDLLSKLPPVPRRTSPWKAAVLGGLSFGIGIAGYFRTKLDVAVGVVMTIVIFAGFGSQIPDDVNAPTPPAALVFLYSSLAVVALYGALRAVSSNHRRTQMPQCSPSERRGILLTQLDDERWRVESVGQYDAVVAGIRRPRHWMHLAISLWTFGLWIPVWIVLTSSSRRRPQWCYYRLFVTKTGETTRERIPPADQAAVRRSPSSTIRTTERARSAQSGSEVPV